MSKRLYPVTDYLDILKDWERTTANPVIYDNIDTLFPAFGFRRIQEGTDKDRWISSLKLDLSRPKTPNKEKTVVCAVDFKFREQGEWENSVGVIDKLMDEYGYSSVYDVYRYIASRFCLDMPTAGNSSNKVEKSKNKILDALQDYFCWNLANNNSPVCSKAREYLSGRGFDGESIKKLGFGFVPSWDKVQAYITSPRMRFSKQDLDNACRVRSEDGYTTIGRKHVLAIPYRCGGELKGFLFRAIDSDIQPKYKANTGLERTSSFFNMPSDRKEKSIIVVEGEMDALTATAAGIEGVVAIGGSDITGERRSLIYDALGRNTKKITLCLDLDADKEGKPNGKKRFNAVRRSLHTIFDISSDFNEVYVASFPVVTDPDEYIRKYGAESFQRIIDKAVPWWEYLSRNLGKK